MPSIWKNTGCDSVTGVWYYWSTIGEQSDILGNFFPGPNGLLSGTHAIHARSSSLEGLSVVVPELYGACPTGVDDTQAVLHSIVEALRSTLGGELCLTEGASYRITTDLVLPDSVELSGLGKLNIDSAALSISSPDNVKAPQFSQVFDISNMGIVIFAESGVVPLCWFGARSDTLDDASKALQEACDSLIAGGVVLVCGEYLLSSDVTISDGITLEFADGLFVLDDGVIVTFFGNPVLQNTSCFDECLCVTGGGVVFK